jgi:glycosyltransferase involved in cell wall biosynthesis
MKKRILFVLPERWYVEAHAELIRRYLSDEFFIEIALTPYPPFKDFLSRYPETNPFQRSPDEYDLLWPMLPSHWQIPGDEYAHKVVTVFYGPNEGRSVGVALVGAATPMVEKACIAGNIPYHSLRFGVDTELFKPYPMIREDNLLHVGYIGTHQNPRHMVKDVIMKQADIPGVRLMIYPTSWINDGGNLDNVGGAKDFLPHVVGGDVAWNGLPNIYNQLDVVLRMDQDPAYSFPTQEAASCGVPVIACDSGIDHLFTEAGAGILIPGDRPYYMEHEADVAKKVREAIIWMRDHPKERKEMGIKGREEVLKNWTWDKNIDAWREFFRAGLKNAVHKNK